MRRRRPTQHVILGVLMTEPMHGYEIDKFLSSQLGKTWHVSTSQLYLMLQKLEVRGMVESLVSVQSKRPSKRIIQITDQGRSCFLLWVRSPTQHLRELRIEFLTKLFFFHRLSLKEGEVLIQAQLRLLENLKNKIEMDWAKQTDPFQKLALGFKIAQFELCINWVKTEARSFLETIG